MSRGSCNEAEADGLTVGRPSRSAAASRQARAAVQKKSQEKGMASKSATATKAKVNEKEAPREGGRRRGDPR